MIVLNAIHVYVFDQATERPDRGVAFADSFVYLQVLLLYAIFSAAIPAMNRWLRKFDSSMGTTWQETAQSYDTGAFSKNSRSKQNILPSTTVQSNASDGLILRRSPNEGSLCDGTAFRPDPVQYTAVISGGPDVQGPLKEARDNQSDDANTIHKEQCWQVRYDDEAAEGHQK
jgi:hypothetical protein